MSRTQGQRAEIPGYQSPISGSAIVPTYQERNQRRGGGYILWLIICDFRCQGGMGIVDDSMIEPRSLELWLKLISSCFSRFRSFMMDTFVVYRSACKCNMGHYYYIGFIFCFSLGRCFVFAIPYRIV